MDYFERSRPTFSIKIMRIKSPSVMASLIAMSSSSSSSSGAAAVSRKAAIRARVKEAIQGLSPERIQEHSKAAITKLQSMPEWTSSRVICLYLSMAPEIQTYDCIKHAFDEGKQVFIPKVTGKRSEDMMMFQLESFDTINTFPKSKWGIPEPPMEVIQQAKDGTCAGIVDTVIVPLCAFDKDCGRVGHGKGYYGT